MHTFSVAYTKQCVVSHIIICYKLNYKRTKNKKNLRHQVKLLISWWLHDILQIVQGLTKNTTSKVKILHKNKLQQKWDNTSWQVQTWNMAWTEMLYLFSQPKSLLQPFTFSALEVFPWEILILISIPCILTPGHFFFTLHYGSQLDFWSLIVNNLHLEHQNHSRQRKMY